MIRVFPAVVILLALTAGAAGQTFYGTTDLAAFREGRDREFRSKSESPLTDAGFAAFEGLKYFPNDSRFRVPAVFTRVRGEKYFMMPTSSGKAKRFVKYGVLEFRLDNRPYRLSVYQADEAARAAYPDYAELLFIPFRDLTSGKETYSVGRYIDIKLPKGNRVVLDLNLAYNPNCAYGNDKFSCPIPPKENYLAVRVTAGELNYEGRSK